MTSKMKQRLRRVSDPSIHSLDKKLDTLTSLIERDFESNKEFKGRTSNRIERLEVKVEVLKDGLNSAERIQTERIYNIEKQQAETKTILASVQAIKGQIMRVMVNGFFGIFSIISIAGGCIVYFLRG
jgi:hypothetical protein